MLKESLRMENARQETVAMQVGARVEGNAIVPPDVGERAPLGSLPPPAGAGGALWDAKLRWLERTYGSMSSVRGDGNCFYRALWIGLMERLRALDDGAAREAYWQLQLPETCTRFAPHLPEAQRARFAELGARFAERTRHLSEPSAVDEGALLKAARQTAETAPLLEWLRLLASACMQGDRQTYEHVAPEGMSLEAFCAREVEAMGIEADEPQVQALASALDLRVRVEYLDGSPHHRHVICGPECLRAEAGQAHSGASWRELAVCLLFRPGHYDVLVPRDWAAAAAPDDASFVPPAP